jgi:zinc transport system substrate-binding protein
MKWPRPDRIGWTVALTATLLAAGCRPPDEQAVIPDIAVTTSYLEAAVTDLLGKNQAVLRLAEPGACPGHYDIRPSQVRALRQCRALFRFDFQKSLDRKLSATGDDGPQVCAITIPGGMCRPESYLTACRQVADHLIGLGRLDEEKAARRLRIIADRLDALKRDATVRISSAGLQGAPVIASSHQADFCQSLGLEVVAEFRAADTAGIGEIEIAIRDGEAAGVKRVIANLPEGRRTADALAERLNAQVVVFGNFPGEHDGRVSFDRMFLDNLNALLGAGGTDP